MLWFKFDPLMWLTGRIQRQPADVQVAFLRLMCLYWSDKCDMTHERAEVECGADEFAVLVKNKIVKTDGEYISISFLDALLDEARDKSTKAKAAAQKSWNNEARAKRLHIKAEQTDADAYESDANALQPQSVRNADKTRQDKTRQDKTTTTTDNVVVDGSFSHYQTKIETEKEVKPADIDNSKYLNELLTDEMWQGSTCVAYKLPNKRLKDYLVSFYEHLVTVAKQHPNTMQFRRHFVNWLQTQISNAKEPAIKYEP
jgi:hypothetical protein